MSRLFKKHVESFTNHPNLSPCTRMVSKGVYDTVFTCRGGEVLVLRIDVSHMQRQRSWRSFRGDGGGGADHHPSATPIVVRLWGCHLSTEHVLIDKDLHVRLAYHDDKLLGAAIMDVVVQLQLNPPQILVFTDPELEALQPQQQQPQQQQPPPPPPVPQQIVQHHQPPSPSSLRTVLTAPSTEASPSSSTAAASSFIMVTATVTTPSSSSPPVLRDPPAAYDDQGQTDMALPTNQHRPAVVVAHTVHSSAQSSFLAPSYYHPHHDNPQQQQQQDVILVRAEPVPTRDGCMMMMAHHDGDYYGCGG